MFQLDAYKLYTDGSKTGKGSAYAAVTEGEVVARKDYQKRFIFTAEPYATGL